MAQRDASAVLEAVDFGVVAAEGAFLIILCSGSVFDIRIALNSTSCFSLCMAACRMCSKRTLCFAQLLGAHSHIVFGLPSRSSRSAPTSDTVL